METEEERQKLLKEARELDRKITLTEKERKAERVKLFHKFNETKDCAQTILGALAELKGTSTIKLYENLNLQFDTK